jgi:hypothetical protein
MASAGLIIKDLQGPALERLAIKDSRDLLLIDGFPPHPRASEAKALAADSMKSEAYRATFDRETAEWAMPGVVRAASFSARAVSAELPEQVRESGAMLDAKQGGTTPRSAERVGADINSMRSEGDTTEKRRAIPPLEDRFNVKRIGLIEKEYHFRDQAGKVAFTDKLLSISTGSESPAAIKAMVDRAAERGWETVRLDRFTGVCPARMDCSHCARSQISRSHTDRWGPGSGGQGKRRDFRSARLLRSNRGQPKPSFESSRLMPSGWDGDRSAAEIGGQRQLAAAIEKALAEGKVSPELRGQVRAMMKAEGAKRAARGERFKLPVYDARAPRTRAKIVQTGPQRHGDRERSR